MNTCRKILTALAVVILYPFFSTTAFAQSLGLIDLQIVNKNEKPVSEKIIFISLKNRGVYTCQSSSKGLCSIKLPINDSYIVQLFNHPNRDTIIIPDDPPYHLIYKISLMRGSDQDCNLKLVVKNTDGFLMKGEKAYLRENNSSTRQSSVTDSNGGAVFKTKPGASYILEYLNAPDYDLIEMPADCGGEFQYSSTMYLLSNTEKEWPNRKEMLH